MKSSSRFAVVLVLAGAILLAGLVTLAGRASAAIDLTGTWTVVLYGGLGGTVGFPCPATFVQSGSNLTGKIDCTPPIGEPPPLSLFVAGSFDKGARTFSTTTVQNGSFTGSVSETGNCMWGQWTLFPGTPYTLEGTFIGSRGACSYTPTPVPTRTPPPPPSVGGISLDLLDIGH